jgi:hypothetical protein
MTKDNSRRMTWNRAYQFSSRNWHFILIGAFILLLVFHPNQQSGGLFRFGTPSNPKLLHLATWNIAAINNNPFEYWITSPDPNYNSLMQNVSQFIINPKDGDIPIDQVFTQQMFDELLNLMKTASFTGLEETKKYWEDNFKNRKIISEFIKDSSIGKKRLASMPDRVTNTFVSADEKSIMRPTVINCYDGKMDTIDQWWTQWKEFMFSTKVSIKQADGSIKSTYIYQMLPKIEKSKYPAITTEESMISIPLQTLSMAIFDAILLTMMNSVTANHPSAWQSMRSTMCKSLNSRKNDRIVEILEQTYRESEIIFLQEVAGNFLKFVNKKNIIQYFDIYQSDYMDPDRDQNSFIMLKKHRFIDIQEVTPDVDSILSKQNNGTKVPVVKGDLIVLLAKDSIDDISYILASFHGDTNG